MAKFVGGPLDGTPFPGATPFPAACTVQSLNTYASVVVPSMGGDKKYLVRWPGLESDALTYTLTNGNYVSPTLSVFDPGLVAKVVSISGLTLSSPMISITFGATSSDPTTPITYSISGDLPDGTTFTDGVLSGEASDVFMGDVYITPTQGGVEGTAIQVTLTVAEA